MVHPSNLNTGNVTVTLQPSQTTQNDQARRNRAGGSEDEFAIAQDSAGPAPSQDQFKLGLAISERLFHPDNPDGWDDETGVPVSLSKGVIGDYASDQGGYTVVVGKGTSVEAIWSEVLDGLPAEAADELTIIESDVAGQEFVDVWLRVNSFEWTRAEDRGFGGYLDARTQTIVVELDPEWPQSEVVSLRSISPLVEVRIFDEPLSRAVGGRFNDSAPHFGGARIGS